MLLGLKVCVPMHFLSAFVCAFCTLALKSPSVYVGPFFCSLVCVFFSDLYAFSLSSVSAVEVGMYVHTMLIGMLYPNVIAMSLSETG